MKTTNKTPMYKKKLGSLTTRETTFCISSRRNTINNLIKFRNLSLRARNVRRVSTIR